MTYKVQSTYHRPTVEMRPDQIDLIVEGFVNTFTVRRAAGWAMVSPYHVKLWMEKGENDLTDQKETIYAELFSKVAKGLSDKAREILAKIQTCPKNVGGLTWLLEKCFKADYGGDTDEMKELIDLYAKLLESYKRLADNRNLGANNGGEIHQESD